VELADIFDFFEQIVEYFIGLPSTDGDFLFHYCWHTSALEFCISMQHAEFILN